MFTWLQQIKLRRPSDRVYCISIVSHELQTCNHQVKGLNSFRRNRLYIPISEKKLVYPWRVLEVKQMAIVTTIFNYLGRNLLIIVLFSI